MRGRPMPRLFGGFVMSSEQGPNVSPPRRRWRRRLLAAAGAALLLVVMAPYLFSWGPCRRLILSVVPTRIHGTISAERASAGWFSAPVLEEFAIRADSGEPLISVESVELEQPLWRLLSHPSDLGRIKAEHPRVHLLLREQGSNFEDVFHIPIRLRPAADQAARRQPAAEKPAAEKPAAEKPAAEKPAAEKPAAEKPAAEKPAAEKPAAEIPAADAGLRASVANWICG